MTYKKLTIEEVRSIIAGSVPGRIIPRHDEFGHHYEFTDSGKIVDSITQKISTPKPHLLKWYGRQSVEWMEPYWPTVTAENREDLFTQASLAGERYRDDAGDVGTAGHDAIESWINEWIATGVAPDNIVPFVKPNPRTGVVETRAIAVARSAQRFFKDNPYYVPVTAELLVGDSKLGIAGTLDVLLYDTRTQEIVVGDWKSSNGVSDDYAIQVGTYRHCLRHMTGLRLANWCLIVKLSKQYDKYELFTVKNPTQAFQMYKHDAAKYNWLGNGIPKVAPLRKVIKI